MNSKATKLLAANFVQFLAAAAVAVYMVWHHYGILNGTMGFGSFCSINQTFDCDAVNASAYSEFLRIPLATWALGYYLFAAVLCWVGWKNVFARREALLMLTAFSSLGVLANFATLGVQLLILKKLCVMCMTLHAFDFSTFIVTILALRDHLNATSLSQELKNVERRRIVTLLVVGGALLGTTHLISAQLKQDIPFDDQAFINEFRAQKPVTIDPADSPREGFAGANPPVQLIEFADFQCPACGFAAKFMHRLVKVYGDRVQLVFKNYPLDTSCNPNVPRPMHEYACFAAKAGLCAKQQGKFFELYEQMFGNQREINLDKIREWAAKLGLDMSQFESCINSPETSAALSKDIETGKAAGLESTPTFFVNGRKVEGAIDEQRLRALLRELGK